MVFIPPKTMKRKVEALRSLLSGANLHTILKGMPTVLARSDDTVPRSLDKLREVTSSATVDGFRFSPLVLLSFALVNIPLVVLFAL